MGAINNEYNQFLDIYRGHSSYIPATPIGWCDEDKKFKFNYKKFRLVVNEDAVIKHVQYGSPHMVINPISDETGLCKFGAIDYDKYENKEFMAQIKQKIISKKYPLNIVESVSGGLHLYLYVDEGIEPDLMIGVLQYYRKLLDLPVDTEIFPKQNALTKQNPFGNNIKLPCAGVKEKGLREHLKRCTKLMLKKEDISKLPIELTPIEKVKTKLNISARQIRENIKNKIPHIKGGTYDNWITDLVAKYVYVGMSNRQILFQLNKLAEYSKKSKEPDYFENKISNCRKHFKTEDPEFLRELFLRNIIYIRQTTNYFNLALNGAYKKDAIDTEFKNIMQSNKNGTKPKPSDWFALSPKKIIVEDYLYRPSQYDEEQPIITYRDKKYLNSYKPNDLEPVPGDIGIFEELLELLFPDQEIREKVLDWYCHIVQNPGDKIRYAILLYSPEQQFGKGSLFGLMRKILGKENTTEIDVGEALDKAKKFLNKQLVLIDELKSDEKFNTNKKLVNMLKRLITEENHGTRELYIDYKEVVSTTNYVLHSNEEDALAIGQNDPRYFVIGCYGKPKPEDWYNKLWDYIGRGDEPGPGVKHFYHFLLNRKIRKSFNPKGRAPTTEYSKNMANAGEHPLTQRVREDFENGAEIFRAMTVSTTDVRIYYEKIKGVKIHRPNDISKALESIGGVKFGQVECHLHGAISRHPTIYILDNHKYLKTISKSKMQKDIWRPIYYYDQENKLQKYHHGEDVPF